MLAVWLVHNEPFIADKSLQNTQQRAHSHVRRRRPAQSLNAAALRQGFLLTGIPQHPIRTCQSLVVSPALRQCLLRVLRVEALVLRVDTCRG